MKKQIKGVSTNIANAVAVALVLGGALTAQSALAATAGIVGSKHNLGSLGEQNNKFTTAGGGAGEICVFCHTPHGAQTADKIPLWNRSSSTTTYTTYSSLGTLSLDGGTAAVGSTSMACLSCHDGTQAMNTVINAPGSGLAGDAAWQKGIADGTGWSGTAQSAGKMTGLASVGSAAEDSLRNDHPISIQYAGGPKVAANIPRPSGGVVADYTKTNFKDPDFKPAKSAVLGGNQVWWVETNDDGSRQKTDLPLYARSGEVTFTDGSTATIAAGAANVQPFVECASCHDPHSSKPTFLRTENTNSAVCLACHDK